MGKNLFTFLCIKIIHKKKKKNIYIYIYIYIYRLFSDKYENVLLRKHYL